MKDLDTCDSPHITVESASPSEAITSSIVRKKKSWVVDTDESAKEIVIGPVIGTGTSSDVFQGFWRGQDVALKVLKGSIKLEEELPDELLKELEILMNFRCPQVVTFHGVIMRPKLALLMEYCNKGSLHHFLQNKFDFNWTLFFSFALQSAKALRAMHGWKPPLLHRDIKTLNYLVTGNNSIKLSDFGLSREDTDRNKESLTSIKGTLMYLAPELLQGITFTDKSDAFSYANVLWELLHRCMTGVYQVPYYQYKHDFQIIAAISEGKRMELPPGTPESLTLLLNWLWKEEPTERPSLEKVCEALEKSEGQFLAQPEVWEALRKSGDTSQQSCLEEYYPPPPLPEEAQPKKDLPSPLTKKANTKKIAKLLGVSINEAGFPTGASISSGISDLIAKTKSKKKNGHRRTKSSSKTPPAEQGRNRSYSTPTVPSPASKRRFFEKLKSVLKRDV